jgi:hypothetical protein
MHDPTLFILIALGGVALAGGISYFVWAAEKKRSAALADMAVRMGFTFEPKVPAERLATLGPFHLFTRGHRRTARNLMTGKADDGPAMLLDYQYTVGGGKDSHTYRQTVAIFQGVRGLPEFTLAPEHFWHRIGSLLGYQDINFETSEEFSRHYVLRGPDEAAIRAAFGAEPLGFFAQNQGWSVESCTDSLAVYRSAKRAKPEELQAFLAETAAVRRALVRR